jgi:hypothetical protein
MVVGEFEIYQDVIEARRPSKSSEILFLWEHS